jgi:hypothetical protein
MWLSKFESIDGATLEAILRYEKLTMYVEDWKERAE